MFIKNLEGSNINVYGCTPFIGRYLVNERSIPVLSIDGSKWYFSKTDLLEEVLKSMPFYLKVLDIF
jgi:hypothetical protein